MSNRNVAVFIDAENLFKGYGKLQIPDVPMADILRQLEDAVSREAGAGSIALSRAFADWNAVGLEDYRREVERSGVETVQVFSAGIASKNAADIVLVVDCLRSATDLEQLEVFILVSGDGDFVPLVRRLHELNKYVVGATLAGHGVNSLLEQEVDQYVELKLENTAKVAKKPAKKVVKQAQSGVPDATPATSPEPPTPARPRRSSTPPNWHGLAQDIPVVHAAPATAPADYKAAIKEVLNDSKARSFCDQLANHGGTLPQLAVALKAAAPQLSPSDARVSSLLRALRFALADTQYALARESDDVQPVLVRRGDAPRGMLSDLSLEDIERGVQ